MTKLSGLMLRTFPLLPLLGAAQEASRSDSAASGGSSCSSTLENTADFIALADDLDALNRSTGNKLLEIPRVPCSGVGDWILEESPVILEGCCFALESAFHKGETLQDCSNEDDFLPLDYFNMSAQFLLEHCGELDVLVWPRQDAFQDYVTSLAAESEEAAKMLDATLLEMFNLTASELIAGKRYNLAQYIVGKTNFQVHHRPKHILGYFNPWSFAPRSLWCPAHQKQIAEQGFPTLSLFRHFQQSRWKFQEHRSKHWDKKTRQFLCPKATTFMPAHLHRATGAANAEAVLLTEGKKHWQMMEATAESFSDLQPLEGFKGKSVPLQKFPVDLADDYPVYVATQLPGEVVLMPRNWAHFAYSMEDSISTHFVV
mmetsp:Transcript_63033/g.133047  ORF Transcript_63033/g.133047 Transcript_63033/m.133047 type:complete len:372 (+) Transcript_63033:75-1190(+)